MEEDSFFGFDAELPPDDSGRRTEEDSEDVYDALNDETFGSAIKGDWERSHEHLVKLDTTVRNGSRHSSNSFNVGDDYDELIGDDDEGSDLELNLSRVKLDDVDIGTDDNETRVQLDPNVWANPLKCASSTAPLDTYSNPEAFLRQHFSNPFEVIPSNCHQQSIVQQNMHHQQHVSNSLEFQSQNNFFAMSSTVMKQPQMPHKICTVEDVERNIRLQQQQQQQPQLHQSMKAPSSKASQQLVQHIQPPVQHQGNANFFNNRSGQMPGACYQNPRLNFNIPPQGPINILRQGLPNAGGNRMPPCFSTMLPGNSPHPNFSRQMPNLPIALNNFAMHPNFNAMRPVMVPNLCSPRMSNQTNMMQMQQPINSNQFNQRLMQEIQQNHPMLLNRNGYNPPNHNMQNVQPQYQQQQQQQHLHSDKVHHHHHQQQNVARTNGYLSNEHDEYANLMSTRDKHWLIGIQLSQLNSETPYVDDYYYTIYKERKAKLAGDLGQSRTHKDNQLNHPLTQPKGHAQLILIQMGNKNGQNNRNGQNQHERRYSESTNSNQKDQPQQQQQQQRSYTHTPLQFENSLGKLQYGSVTAPRKIIDMEIMANDSVSQSNSTVSEISAQRKSRYILLQIETLYKIVLKLEDLLNPAAIATSLLIKEKKEKEKQQALEQNLMLEINNKNRITEKGNDKNDSNEASVHSSISDKFFAFDLESKDTLLSKAIPHLTLDNVVAIMSVRKGKVLIRRLLPHIEEHEVRWIVWIGAFSSLQAVLKKDKDDAEGGLYALYSIFQKHISEANLDILVKIANAMPISEKKLNGFFSSKFCISSLFVLILRAEEIFSKNDSKPDKNEYFIEQQELWMGFLQKLSATINRTIENQTITAAIESTSIKPVAHHLTRFKNLKLHSLQALFSQAHQHVN